MDEKRGSLLGVSLETMKERNATSWRKISARAGLALVVLMLWSCDRTGWSGCGDRMHNEKEFNAKSWNEIKPSSDLVWYSCYDKYDCAKLEVPLDWLDETDPRRATIAIIRYNATDRSDYKGPVFINPGGPGGSGIWFVKHLAPYYQSVVGRNHDIISFDPRGIGITTPIIDCWNSTLGSTSALLWDTQDPPNVDAHPGSVYDAYAHAAAFSHQCAENIGEAGRFVSTPSIARDMLAMTEKLGEERIQYWGFSHVTFLGMTFATLLLDKVGRMVLDVSAGAGTHFRVDTDAVMDAFYTYCHKAGLLLCAFSSDSSQAIETHLDNLLADIKVHPVIIPASPTNPRPEIISYSKVRRMIVSAFYRPFVVFPSLAEVLAALEKGDGRPFIDLTSQGGEELPICQKQYDPKDCDPKSPTPERPEAEGNSEATRAIMCSDARPTEGGVEEFSRYVDTLVGLSKSAGASMSSMWMVCAEWGIKAKWEFRGPYEGNTSHPILLVANAADNVTPYRSALRKAKCFPGSVVMVQDSYGHAILAMPSKCTALNIQKRFQTDELPATGTVCPPDYLLFERWNVTSWDNAKTEELESIALDEVLWKLMNSLVAGLDLRPHTCMSGAMIDEVLAILGGSKNLACRETINFHSKDLINVTPVIEDRWDYGVSTFYANAWSAPGYMETNGNENNRGYLCGVSGENCTSGDWKAYADYLISYMKFYAEEGINFTHGEPQNAASYAGMLSSGTQAADFIKALYSELKSANMSNIAIACYDAEGWNDRKSMISQIKSPGAESMLGIVTSHTYTSNFNGPISTTEKVLQMEHSDLIGGWTTAWYSSGSSGDGQAWASAVHNGLVNNNLSGYLYRVATRGGSTNEKLIQTSATGYSVSKRLWALAQFSRFIRPNAARVGVNGAPSALSTSAFLNSADAEVYAGALVVPALNTGSAAQSVTSEPGDGGFEWWSLGADGTFVVSGWA
ncbi:hypothetical protein BDZ45DRAFT_750218 [Acephala macrosclerotiorum]|nr:hypothetical protein BDZ45DRAFT_750218 [Acephala macrosclerotiorum]